jgi:L-asparaginase / beta-aspartyl-peptidase
LDAVEAAIVILEDDPFFDAGFGSNLNLDGRAELDAIVMDGRTLKSGAVAAVSRIRNPIRLARRVLESSEHMLLVAAGAEQFAAEQGMALCDPAELITERARSTWRQCRSGALDTRSSFPPPIVPPGPRTGSGGGASGTVGAVALESSGNLVAGTSTGGTRCKHAGRVGDSPLIGCGCYADAEAGGVSCTGWGEAIMKIVMAKTATDFLRRPASGSSPESASMDAARETVRLLENRAHGTGGLILLDWEGRPGFAFNTARMVYGFVAQDGSLVQGI